MAKRNDSGMTEATITVVRQLNRNKKTMNATSRMPSSIFRVTVWTVESISLVLSIKGTILTSSGRTLSLSSEILSLRRAITALGFSPRSMITIPCTTSSS